MKTTLASVLLATSTLTANAQFFPTVVVNQPPVACSRPQQNNGYYLDNLFRDTQQRIDYVANTGWLDRHEVHYFYKELDYLKARRFRMARRDGYLDPYEQQALVADLQVLNSRIPSQRYRTPMPRHNEHHNYPNNGYPNTYPNNYPNGNQNGYPNNYPNNGYPNGNQNRHEDHDGRHDNGRHDNGRHDNGRHDNGRHDNGRHDNGRHDNGRYNDHDGHK
jgi:hypothetical protein